MRCGSQEGEYKKVQRVKKDDGGVGDKLKYRPLSCMRLERNQFPALKLSRLRWLCRCLAGTS